MKENQEYQDWKENTLKPALERFPERKENFSTRSGIPLPRVALPGDRDYGARLGYPGEPPYTRGAYPTMYRGRLWTMRQYAGYASAEETNRRFRYLLAQGQTGLSVAFDLPTQIGLDPDHPLSIGEVGRVGVSVASLEDMEALFEGIPLDQVQVPQHIEIPLCSQPDHLSKVRIGHSAPARITITRFLARFPLYIVGISFTRPLLSLVHLAEKLLCER